eukprot:scaffold10025_cov54-Attheya_sp.AAC.3
MFVLSNQRIHRARTGRHQQTLPPLLLRAARWRVSSMVAHGTAGGACGNVNESQVCCDSESNDAMDHQDNDWTDEEDDVVYVEAEESNRPLAFWSKTTSAATPLSQTQDDLEEEHPYP